MISGYCVTDIVLKTKAGEYVEEGLLQGPHAEAMMRSIEEERNRQRIHNASNLSETIEMSENACFFRSQYYALR